MSDDPAQDFNTVSARCSAADATHQALPVGLSRGATEPKTLEAAVLYFADPVNCREYLVARRWPNGVELPHCASKDVLFLENDKRWHSEDWNLVPRFIAH
jgi:hypothetical protein